MKYKPFALMLAAALLAGTLHASAAENAAEPPPAPEYAEGWGPGHYRGYGHRGFRHRGPDGGRFGHRGFGFGLGHGPRHGGFGWGFGGGHHMRLIDTLELDDAQKTKFIDVMTENFRERLQTKLELRDLEEKLRDLRDDETAQPEAIVAASAAVGEAEGKLEVLGRKHIQSLKGILNEEQLKQLEELRDAPPSPRGDRKDWRESRRGPGPDGPRGPGGPGKHHPRMERGPGPRR